MTSKLKCPVCQWCNQPMVLQDDIFVCANTDCSACAESFLHKALIQAKRDLETAKADIADYKKHKALWEQIRNNTILELERKFKIARKALEETQHWLGVVRCSAVSHLNNQNNTLLEHYETDPTVQNIDKAKSILKQYLEQIEHKENQ